MDARDLRIIDALRTNETLSTAQIAGLIGMSTRGTRTRLQSLVERGLVIEIGSGATDPRPEIRTSGYQRTELNSEALGIRVLPSKFPGCSLTGNCAWMPYVDSDDRVHFAGGRSPRAKVARIALIAAMRSILDPRMPRCARRGGTL
jgi:Winged helix-turn-helix DNA-binding